MRGREAIKGPVPELATGNLLHPPTHLSTYPPRAASGCGKCSAACHEVGLPGGRQLACKAASREIEPRGVFGIHFRMTRVYLSRA